MYFLYNITVYIVSFILEIVAIFNKKIHLFVNGRKNVFEKLVNHFNADDAIIWFHCASLGEFEQGRPIIEKCKEKFKNHKILVTFFSPSGYEIRKDYAVADLVTYLPLDTKKNAKRFLKIVNPEIAIFVKYEFWPNLLKELSDKNIKTILVSGIFRKDQSFFKWYGSWMKKSLKTFDHFFVQNHNSVKLLKQINFTNVILSGDTRFDRVNAITKEDINLNFAKQFVSGKTVLIAGSTWPKDEELIIDYINTQGEPNQKFIIAPHNLNLKNIQNLKDNISNKAILYSDINSEDLSKYQVIIIDTIGLLSKIYYYADIAYVGGGFGTGIHNVLEPATFEVPIIIGPNYQKFKEAKDLVKLGACKVITSNDEFNFVLTSMLKNKELRNINGKLSREYIVDNVGATSIIFDYLNKTIGKK